MTAKEKELLDSIDTKRAYELIQRAFDKKRQSWEDAFGDKLPEVLAKLSATLEKKDKV